MYIYVHTCTYASVERYTHIVYDFPHIYLCAFKYVNFTSQNTTLWNRIQANVLDYIPDAQICQDQAIFVFICNMIKQDIVPHCTLAIPIP